jgi:hypothetical protein
VPALKALDADIRPQPYHLPLIAAAGVGLLETDDVTELDIHGHATYDTGFDRKRLITSLKASAAWRAASAKSGPLEA